MADDTPGAKGEEFGRFPSIFSCLFWNNPIYIFSALSFNTMYIYIYYFLDAGTTLFLWMTYARRRNICWDASIASTRWATSFNPWYKRNLPSSSDRSERDEITAPMFYHCVRFVIEMVPIRWFMVVAAVLSVPGVGIVGQSNTYRSLIEINSQHYWNPGMSNVTKINIYMYICIYRDMCQLCFCLVQTVDVFISLLESTH